MELETLNFYGKEESVELLSQMLQGDLNCVGEVLSKGLTAIEKRKIKKVEEQVNNLTAKRDSEWKKAMRYHKDKIDHMLFNKPIPAFYGAKDLNELIAYGNHIMDNVQSEEYTKRIDRIASRKEREEEEPEEKPSRDHSHPHNHSNRSDSEDCCKRAEKAVYD